MRLMAREGHDHRKWQKREKRKINTGEKKKN